MRSDAATVDEYISGSAPARREALALLRRLCREELSGFDEAMRHGMPSYLRDGSVEVAFAGQASYISLYVLRRGAFDAHVDRFAGLSVGKGCIRFRRPEQIDETRVRPLLAAAATDAGPVC